MHMANSKCNNKKNYKFNVIAYYLATAIVLHIAHASPSINIQPTVKINKCCEKFEIIVNSRCTNAASVNSCEYFVKQINIV